MSEKPQPSVIGSLPSTRPHRRSGKRAAAGGPADGSAATPTRQPTPADEPGLAAAKPTRAKPAAARTQAANRARAKHSPSPAVDLAAPAPASHGALQTAVEAAAELTEIGLRAGARALRIALSRLPKP